MTRQEIEKAIENGESVWVVFKENFDTRPNLLYEVNKQNIIVAIGDIGVFYFNKLLNRKFRASFSECFKTHLEALHYANHANISRTETLPFLTWEEFLKKKDIRFYTKDGDEVRLYITDDGNKIYVIEFKPYGYLGKWNATEANFYKAYNECVKLFLGRED